MGDKDPLQLKSQRKSPKPHLSRCHSPNSRASPPAIVDYTVHAGALVRVAESTSGYLRQALDIQLNTMQIQQAAFIQTWQMLVHYRVQALF